MKRNKTPSKGKRQAPGCPLVIGKHGYQVKVDQNDPETQAWMDAYLSLDFAGHVALACDVAQEALREERIFDWKKWVGREKELSLTACSAIFVLRFAEDLERFISEGDMESALLIAFFLGEEVEKGRAMAAWTNRNPPPSATAAKKAKVQARRERLADYIRKQGERPEKRPGGWYTGFREAHPEHAIGDKTLKADYPHALALLRKRTKTG